jgi:carbon monoxide dehydrogenase subunit G
MHIEHRIDIAATPAEVFALTIDIERWPEVMPTVTSVERLDTGPLVVGSRARLVQPRQRPTVWTVVEIEPDRRFAWEAQVFGVHMVATHTIESTDSGCTNLLALDLSGRGARLMSAVLGRTLGRTLATENDSFRREAETARRR